jgi:hypothetical protein
MVVMVIKHQNQYKKWFKVISLSVSLSPPPLGSTISMVCVESSTTHALVWDGF